MVRRPALEVGTTSPPEVLERDSARAYVTERRSESEIVLGMQLVGNTAVVTAAASRRSLPVVVAVCATCVAAGCGGTASTHVTDVTLMPCRLSRFAVTLGPDVSEATGQHTLALRLENRSVTCVLDGYPRVVLYDAGGVIPFVVRHGGDQMISSDPPKAITIPAGGHAFVVMNKYRCDRGAAPGSRGTRRIRISSAQPGTGSA